MNLQNAIWISLDAKRFFRPRRACFLVTGLIARFILLGRRFFRLIANAVHNIFRIHLAHHARHRTHRALGNRETHRNRRRGTRVSNRGPLESVGTVPAHRSGLGTDHFYGTMWTRLRPSTWYQLSRHAVYEPKIKLFF